MGFWSGLGKVLGAVGPLVAAPFTGGASLAASPILKTIGKVASIAGPIASGLAAGSQKGREGENTAASDQADFRLRESNFNEDNQISRADLDLRQRGDARTGQSDAYKKALQSALGMNIKDFEIDPSSLPAGVKLLKTSGGLRPSAMGAEGKAAHAAMNKMAIEKLLAGEQYDKLPALERTLPAEYKKPGLFENITGAVGMGANAINSANASNEQMSMQERIVRAIEATSGGGIGAGSAAPYNPKVTVGSAGVMPFKKPPTAVFPEDPYGVDTSNR